MRASYSIHMVFLWWQGVVVSCILRLPPLRWMICSVLLGSFMKLLASPLAGAGSGVTRWWWNPLVLANFTNSLFWNKTVVCCHSPAVLGCHGWQTQFWAFPWLVEKLLNGFLQLQGIFFSWTFSFIVFSLICIACFIAGSKRIWFNICICCWKWWWICRWQLCFQWTRE